ncbi:MAG: hypothetical protein IJ206_13020 [Oscillospiraceae bacterium]|nr:hypothetical protein [Oscillospiraceae bacterium]
MVNFDMGQFPFRVVRTPGDDLISIAALKETLADAEIRPNSYAILYRADDRLCLLRGASGWEVLTYERGQDMDVGQFDDLDDACLAMIGELAENKAMLDQMISGFEYHQRKYTSFDMSYRIEKTDSDESQAAVSNAILVCVGIIWQLRQCGMTNKTYYVVAENLADRVPPVSVWDANPAESPDLLDRIYPIIATFRPEDPIVGGVDEIFAIWKTWRDRREAWTGGPR